MMNDETFDGEHEVFNPDGCEMLIGVRSIGRSVLSRDDVVSG